ncbi:hypothetical protein F5Y17DRAFT_431029 [Xylariaceae sp. FL0594]|nr:hypothetical protein F5Y17DRAFT_431029 [Xylariaceae sp. FL0594]
MAPGWLTRLRDNLLGFFYCCLPRRRREAGSPTHRVAHYNAQLRAKLGLRERHLELPPPVVAGLNTTTNTAITVPPPTYKPGRPGVQQGKSAVSQPSSRTSASDLVFALAHMDNKELGELFDHLHEALAHVPYAICGLGALIDHGFRQRRASKISIICPQESKDTIKAWAAAKGYPTSADSIGIPTTTSRGERRLRQVRIKYADSGFDSLGLRRSRISSSSSKALVLSMSSMLDHIAAGYIYHRRRGDERALDIVVRDIFWCLRRVSSSSSSRKEETLDPDFLPTFLGDEFFTDFTTRNHPQAINEMSRAGIDVSAAIAKHRQARVLKEHDEMLNQYGLSGDTVAPKRGAFEGVRDLTNSKSVYTLRDQNSHANLGDIGGES